MAVYEQLTINKPLARNVFFFFCLKIKCNSYRWHWNVFLVICCLLCYLCVCVCFLGLTGSRWPLGPSEKQGDIGVKAAFVDTVHCESILPHLLIRTHSQTPSSSPTFSREAGSRRSLEPRFTFNILFSPPASQHIVTSSNLLGFQPPKTPPIIPQNVPFPPSLGSASPLQLLPRLFSSVVSLIFSPSPSSFSASSSSSGAVCTCLGVSLTLGNLSECSAAAVSWWSEGERKGESEASGGEGGGVAGAVTQHRILSALSDMRVCLLSLRCAEGKWLCDCWGQKLLNLNMLSNSQQLCFFLCLSSQRWERCTYAWDLCVCIFIDSFFFFLSFFIIYFAALGRAGQ